MPLPVGPVTRIMPCGCASAFMYSSFCCRLVAERVDAEHRARRIENTRDDLFAEQRRAGADAEVDRAILRDAHLDAPVLRHAALGDVEARHDLDARRELDGELHRRTRDLFQVAVQAQANAIGLLVRLEVDVRRAFLDRVEQHLVDEAHDRRVFDVVAADRVLLELIVAAGDVEILEIEVVVAPAPASACRPARSPCWRCAAACLLRRRPLRRTGRSGT